MAENEFVFNGIDAATGSYLTPALTVEQVAEHAIVFWRQNEIVVS